MHIECKALTVSIHSRTLLRQLDLSVAAGIVVAVLGPNGAGKTMLLHTLAGLRAPAAGGVWVQGRSIERWPRRELARQLALLPQNIEDPFPATVLQTVLLGRHPHIARWEWESAQDFGIARAAITAVGLDGYESRDVFTLSGGERRRAALAAVLAQTPSIFLLDEPTNHLDPNHQIETLTLLRARAALGASVIVTMHDANLAARFADHVLLIEADGAWRCGDTLTVLTAQNLSRLYRTPFQVIDTAGRRLFFNAEQP